MQAFPADVEAALYRPELQAHFSVQPLRMDRWTAAATYLNLGIGKQAWNDISKAMNALMSNRQKHGRQGGAIPHTDTIEKMYALQNVRATRCLDMTHGDCFETNRLLSCTLNRSACIHAC
jgi:hypothetical protein